MRTAIVALTAGASMSMTVIGAPPPRLVAVVRNGQAAPGITGATFGTVADLRLDAAGGWAFWSRLSGGPVTPSTDTSLWANAGSGLLLRAREGDPAPSGDGGFLQCPTPECDGGMVAFVAPVGTGALNEVTRLGVFTSDPDGVTGTDVVPSTTYARPTETRLVEGAAYRSDDNSAVRLRDAVLSANDPAPNGVYAGAYFKSFNRPGLGANGHAAFRAMIGAPSLPSAGLASAWALRAGSLRMDWYAGQQPPMTGSGALISRIWTHPTVDSTGMSFTMVTLSGAEVTPANDVAVLGADGAGATLIAREDDPLGTVPAASIASFTQEPSAIGGDGALLGAVLKGDGAPNGANRAILRWRAAGGITVVAREGDTSVDLPVGVKIATIGQAVGADDGHAAFTGTLSGPGVGPANADAVFALDSVGEIRTVARAGDPVEVESGDVRTIARVIFEPTPQSVSAPGRVAIKLAFTDGSSGLFEAHVPRCRADHNADGFLNGDDFDEYVADFEAGDIAADYNGDGFATGDDFDAFIADFESGC